MHQKFIHLYIDTNVFTHTCSPITQTIYSHINKLKQIHTIHIYSHDHAIIHARTHKFPHTKEHTHLLQHSNIVTQIHCHVYRSLIRSHKCTCSHICTCSFTHINMLTIHSLHSFANLLIHIDIHTFTLSHPHIHSFTQICSYLIHSHEHRHPFAHMQVNDNKLAHTPVIPITITHAHLYIHLPMQIIIVTNSNIYVYLHGNLCSLTKNITHSLPHRKQFTHIHMLMLYVVQIYSHINKIT